MKEYQHKFEAMANKVDDVNPQVIKEIFISRLKNNIQKDAIKAKPTSLVEAFALAQLYEKIDLGSDVDKLCPSQAIIPYSTPNSVSQKINSG